MIVKVTQKTKKREKERFELSQLFQLDVQSKVTKGKKVIVL